MPEQSELAAPKGFSEEELEKFARTASELYHCARAWDPKACLVGNVTSGDIAELCLAASRLIVMASKEKAYPCVKCHDIVVDELCASCSSDGWAEQFIDALTALCEMGWLPEALTIARDGFELAEEVLVEKMGREEYDEKYGPAKAQPADGDGDPDRRGAPPAGLEASDPAQVSALEEEEDPEEVEERQAQLGLER